MTNRHAFGQSGVDLYLDGVYRSTSTAPKGKQIGFAFFPDLPTQDREVIL